MPNAELSLAIDGRERLLNNGLVPYTLPTLAAGNGGGVAPAAESVAIVGLGYVGLPTAVGLRQPDSKVLGIDVSRDRLRAIQDGDVDLTGPDLVQLSIALADGSIQLSDDVAEIAGVDVVIVCVPTPVDDAKTPDLAALRSACDAVVEHAHSGQTIVLTSTTFVGTTRQLLVEPLQQRGFAVGRDLFVAFSPERIDPGNTDHEQRATPRVVGGVTQECSERAARLVSRITGSVYLVSSPEAAELTKLYENSFRAVTLALANEFSDICSGLGLDPIEVTLAAATKPYGFLGTFPGPGVGGHCIPCDPHYLLWQLRKDNRNAPLIAQAMESIEVRPSRVVARAAEVASAGGSDLDGKRVVVVGVSYKAGVRDLRESSALPIMAGLTALGADVHYYDPLITEISLRDGRHLHSEVAPRGADWDLVVIHTVHPGVEHGWVADCPLVLDATYRFALAPHRQVV